MKSLNVLLSPHAESLIEDIVLGIAEALSVEDGPLGDLTQNQVIVKRGGVAGYIYRFAGVIR